MIKVLMMVTASLFSVVALAKKPVGPAGCGLGNVFFGKDSQILAATTNGSSGTQTFGITSGTSNCVDAQGVAKLESYVEANSIALANDISRGQGETLEGLTQVLQCSTPTEVHSLFKSNYSEIYKNGTDDTAAVTRGMRAVLKSHQEVGQGCKG